MTIKRHRELEETEGFGRAPKLAKFDYDRFQKVRSLIRPTIVDWMECAEIG